MGGSAYPDVHALAVDEHGNVLAGGSFTVAGGVSANYVAKWDGTNWSALGSGMNAGVGALAVDGDGNVYAGGIFTTAGGVSANLVAKWDGKTWSALGTGMSQPYGQVIHALAVDGDGNVYAGGDFTTAGGGRAQDVAKWNGTEWSRLGSGIGGGDYSYVTTLAVDGNRNLYAGGVFTLAGSKGSSNFAIWHGDAIVGVPGVPATAPGFALSGGAPNPFTRSTVVSFDLPRAENVRLEVLDVSGRRVCTLISGSQPAGRHAVTWDGMDERGRRLTAGIYHYRIRAGSFDATRRLVLVP
jgi:hypothetical protein